MIEGETDIGNQSLGHHQAASDGSYQDTVHYLWDEGE